MAGCLYYLPCSTIFPSIEPNLQTAHQHRQILTYAALVKTSTFEEKDQHSSKPVEEPPITDYCIVNVGITRWKQIF